MTRRCWPTAGCAWWGAGTAPTGSRPCAAGTPSRDSGSAGPRGPPMTPPWGSAATPVPRYKEEESRTASRAGHSAMLLRDAGGYQLVVFGGRDSSDCEVAGRWGKGKIHVESIHAPKMTEQLSRLVGSENGSRQAPKGLRHQSCTVVGPFAVAFGGETLTKGRDTVCNDLYVYDTRCSPPSWFRFPCSDRGQKRVGHRTCLWNDKLYLVGGFGPDGKTPCPEICVLEIP
ncbi:hypothetical protein KIL84_005692 [Mauremys mutica]|uniref:Kelch domain containing 9 n=1 Tax=Mauremys mutica TaxID=74926 RepID=A0A9D3XHA5_9SAUR|nr:hypothetical protein KIL84_005692 [Mauremys mutica]